MTTQTADELKQSGNAAFSGGRYDEAVDLFTRAIDAASDEQRHVLFSNRSAAYAACMWYQMLIFNVLLSIFIIMIYTVVDHLIAC